MPKTTRVSMGHVTTHMDHTPATVRTAGWGKTVILVCCLRKAISGNNSLSAISDYPSCILLMAVKEKKTSTYFGKPFMVPCILLVIVIQKSINRSVLIILRLLAF